MDVWTLAVTAGLAAFGSLCIIGIIASGYDWWMKREYDRRYPRVRRMQ